MVKSITVLLNTGEKRSVTQIKAWVADYHLEYGRVLSVSNSSPWPELLRTQSSLYTGSQRQQQQHQNLGNQSPRVRVEKM